MGERGALTAAQERSNFQIISTSHPRGNCNIHPKLPTDHSDKPNVATFSSSNTTSYLAWTEQVALNLSKNIAGFMNHVIVPVSQTISRRYIVLMNPSGMFKSLTCPTTSVLEIAVFSVS